MTDRVTSSWTVPASRFIAGTCASRPRTALGASSTLSSMRILVMSPPVIWEAAKLAMRLVYPRCSSRSSARWHGFAADSAYDTEGVYAAIERHREGRSPRVLIPPTKNAQLRPESSRSRERNRNIRSRTSLGKRTWHTWSGYSKRSLAETTMCRYKTIIGPMVRARTLQGQRVEARVGCQILNRHDVPGNARELSSGLNGMGRPGHRRRVGLASALHGAERAAAHGRAQLQPAVPVVRRAEYG